MGLFDFLFGKKSPATQEHKKQSEAVTGQTPEAESKPAIAGVTKQQEVNYLEDAEVALGVVMPLAFAKHWDQIKKTKLSCISIRATASDELTLTQSKFGHYPYIPAGYAYPKDTEGRYMYPLAQINCSEMPLLPGYPSSGYLQFYVSAFDDVYGIDFDDLRSQKNFKVLYFEEDAIGEPMQDFSFLDEAMNSDMMPVHKPHTLLFSAKDEYIGLGDIRCEKRLKEFSIEDVVEEHPQITKELEEYVWGNFQSNGHKIGGYAYFTQYDPRDGDTEDYILLLQIDSDDHIMWGDVGVANFFIHPKDLANRDFSKVMYSWDCG